MIILQWYDYGLEFWYAKTFSSTDLKPPFLCGNIRIGLSVTTLIHPERPDPPTQMRLFRVNRFEDIPPNITVASRLVSSP